MGGEEEKEGIKVVDRRRFSESGDTRQGVADQRAAEENSSSNKNIHASPEQKPHSMAGPEIQASEISGPGARKSEQSLDAQKPVRPKRPARQGEVDFASFVISLGTQTLVMLGEIPNPETNLVSVNIEAARQTIEILAMIEEKTEGNLTQEESRLIGEVLAGLRLAFARKVENS